MPELLLNAGYSGSISIDEGGANDLPTIAIERNSESSSIAVDEIPLTDADIENILGSGYSHSRTRNHPELCSPLEPVFKALCECYNMIEYERIVDPSIIQKSDKFDVVHTQTGEIRQTLVKPTLPYYAPSDKYGRKSMNLLEKVDKPKGRPKSPSMINLNGGGSRGVGNALNSPSSSVPGSPAGKLRPVDSAPATPVASRTGAKQEDKSSRKYKGSAGTTFQKPRVLVWSHLGLDRAATVVVAYLIRRWNISIVQAIEFVKRNRPGITISPFHMRVLEVWERRFLCGNYVCMDCLVNSGGVTDAEYSASRQGTKKKDDMKAALLNDAGNGKDVTVVVNDGLDKITAGLSLNRKIGTGSTTELTVSHASPEIDGEEKLAQVKYGFIEDSYRAFKAACADDSPLGTKLGDVRDFLHGVRTSHYASTLTQAERTFGGDPAASIHKHHFLEASKYPTISNLCDLNLAGRLLNDGDIERLLEILLNMRIVQHIRTLELQNNHIGNKGLKSIMGALMIPKACFNEELELMSLDLSSNR